MQHINFIQHIERKVEPLLSARQQGIAAIALVVVILAVYAVLLVGDASRSQELDVLQAREFALSTELEELRAKKQLLENSSSIDRALAALQRDISFRRKVITRLNPSDKELDTGFAEHLSGLARQSVDGLWFTSIQLHQGGDELSLMGQTRKPESVPRLLQKLRNETVFSGQQFRVFRLSSDEEPRPVMSFEIRARELVAAE